MTNWIILTIISILFAVLCLLCFWEYHRRTIRREKAVYLPNYLFWIGFLVGGGFVTIAWLAAKQDGSIGLTILFCVFALLGMSLLLGWKNCFIQYDSAGFTQHNFIGMRRSFTYDQVNAWYSNKRNPMESILYVDGKKVSFNLMSKSGTDFLLTVSAAYRKYHGNKNMPVVSGLTKERGGFRAHVYNPGEYLAIFIMLVAFIVGSGTWAVIADYMPLDKTDAQLYHVTFSSWEIQEDSMILTSSQMRESFIIGGCTEHLSAKEALIQACDGETVFTVWAKRYTPEDADPYFRVYALSSGDAIYRTFEDSTAYQREDIPLTIGIFSILLAFVLVFSGLTYIVGSHPEKFPKWVVYCFFKRNAIDI